MRALFVILLLVVAMPALAQSGAGSQDSSIIGHLRPRWGSYLVSAYPSPARANQAITVQVYTHTDEVFECRVFDSAGRDIYVLQAKQSTPAGLHNFIIPPFTLPSGAYMVQLITYTASGATNVVDYMRFSIIH